MSDGLHFNYELTREGAAKMAALKQIPRAQKKNLTAWMASTVQATKASASQMQKSARGGMKKRGGNKSSQMSRNIGMEVAEASDGFYTGAVGTGVGKTQSVVYADPQDKGALVRPEVTAKMRKFFWAAYFATGDDKYKWMALTKKRVLDIFIPRSHWFTGPIERGRAMLDFLMNPDQVLKTAEQMAGTYVPNEWR